MHQCSLVLSAKHLVKVLDQPLHLYQFRNPIIHVVSFPLFCMEIQYRFLFYMYFQSDYLMSNYPITCMYHDTVCVHVLY